MARKPDTLLYGVAENPPLGTVILLAVQHNFLQAASLVFPIALISQVGSGPLAVSHVVALSMMAAGVGTILQAMPRIGSGYVCPNLVGPNFFAVATQAAWIGGMPLVRGMTIAAALVEMLLAPVWRHVKFLFPTEITGLVVFMVGVSVVPLGSSQFLGINYSGEPIQPLVLLVGVVTFVLMASLNVWGGKKIKTWGVLIGLIVGYGLSMGLGLFTAADWQEFFSAPWLAMPFDHSMLQVRFDWSLLLPFAILSVCGSLKTTGNLITSQKINDDDWKEPDMKNVSKGIFADSLSILSAGLLGGLPTDTSASNVGLTYATGVTSRIVGIATGILFLLYGFSPKVTVLLALMPMPVMGAVLLFTACFMMMSGLQIMLSTKIEQRMILVLGTALFFGLSLDILPQLYASVPAGLKSAFQSPLALSTLVAVILNQILQPRRFKGGWWKRVRRTRKQEQQMADDS